MASSARRRRRKKASGVVVAPAPAAAASAERSAQQSARVIDYDAAKLRQAHRNDGLDMLLQRGRLTPLQYRTGRDYGEIERTSEISDAASIRSFLELRPRGGGGAVHAELTAAEWIADCRTRLTRIHAALHWAAEAIAVLNLICARGMHPRDITKDQREAAEIETTLRVLLDQLAVYMREERVLGRCG